MLFSFFSEFFIEDYSRLFYDIVGCWFKVTEDKF